MYWHAFFPLCNNRGHNITKILSLSVHPLKRYTPYPPYRYRGRISTCQILFNLSQSQSQLQARKGVFDSLFHIKMKAPYFLSLYPLLSTPFCSGWTTLFKLWLHENLLKFVRSWKWVFGPLVNYTFIFCLYLLLTPSLEGSTRKVNHVFLPV
jgi:hypothetical protein